MASQTGLNTAHPADVLTRHLALRHYIYHIAMANAMRLTPILVKKAVP